MYPRTRPIIMFAEWSELLKWDECLTHGAIMENEKRLSKRIITHCHTIAILHQDCANHLPRETTDIRTERSGLYTDV